MDKNGQLLMSIEVFLGMKAVESVNYYCMWVFCLHLFTKKKGCFCFMVKTFM